MATDPKTCRLVAVFADNVRRHREQQGLSQEDLAERAGVHRTYIGMLERSEKNVTIYNIERLAEALKVPPGELLTKASRRRPLKGRRSLVTR